MMCGKTRVTRGVPEILDDMFRELAVPPRRRYARPDLCAARLMRGQIGDEHCTGKDLTFSIERDNSDIRYFLARSRRRVKAVSKTVEMVDLCLRLYHHLHDTPRNFSAQIGRAHV